MKTFIVLAFLPWLFGYPTAREALKACGYWMDARYRVPLGKVIPNKYIGRGCLQEHKENVFLGVRKIDVRTYNKKGEMVTDQDVIIEKRFRYWKNDF